MRWGRSSRSRSGRRILSQGYSDGVKRRGAERQKPHALRVPGVNGSFGLPARRDGPPYLAPSPYFSSWRLRGVDLPTCPRPPAASGFCRNKCEGPPVGGPRRAEPAIPHAAVARDQGRSVIERQDDRQGIVQRTQGDRLSRNHPAMRRRAGSRMPFIAITATSPHLYYPPCTVHASHNGQALPKDLP